MQTSLAPDKSRTNFRPVEYIRAFRISVNRTVQNFERQNRGQFLAGLRPKI